MRSQIRGLNKAASNAQDGISNTFTIIPDALGKDSAVFAGDIDVASIREEMEKQ